MRHLKYLKLFILLGAVGSACAENVSGDQTDVALCAEKKENCLLVLARNTEPVVGKPSLTIEKSEDATALPLPTPALVNDSPWRIFKDGKVNFLFRNFFASEDVNDEIRRKAWIQTVQVNYETGYTVGAIGWGASISPYVAMTLDKTSNAGNMAYGERIGTASPVAYLGMYTLNAKTADATIKFGLQRVYDPMLLSMDLYSLPTSFNGISFVQQWSEQLTLRAASFNAVQARGRTELRPMATAYGGTRIDRYSHIGASWQDKSIGSVAMYFDQAHDVWNQVYLSLGRNALSANAVRWTGNANLYYTRDQGASRQQDINNLTYSVSLSAEQNEQSLMLAFQEVVGNQYFNYIRETWGNSLANAMDVDYSAPHEKSLQLRYQFDGKKIDLPGLNMMVWTVFGWGADAQSGAKLASAQEHPLHNLYWKTGQPIHGKHQEFGINPVYRFGSGRLSGAKLSILAIAHRSTPYYLESGNREYKVKLDIPFQF